jgi:hypothetical protein
MTLALEVDVAVRASRQDDWRGNRFKIRKVSNAIRAILESAETKMGVGEGSCRGRNCPGPSSFIWS